MEALDVTSSRPSWGRPDDFRSFFHNRGYLLIRNKVDGGSASPAAAARRTFVASGRLDRISGLPPKGLYWPITSEAYRMMVSKLWRIAELHRLVRDRGVATIVASLLEGAQIFVRSNWVPRLSLPEVQGEASSTRAHQDHSSIQGILKGATAWFPLLNCATRHGLVALHVGRPPTSFVLP